MGAVSWQRWVWVAAGTYVLLSYCRVFFPCALVDLRRPRAADGAPLAAGAAGHCAVNPRSGALRQCVGPCWRPRRVGRIRSLTRPSCCPGDAEFQQYSQRGVPFATTATEYLLGVLASDNTAIFDAFGPPWSLTFACMLVCLHVCLHAWLSACLRAHV